MKILLSVVFVIFQIINSFAQPSIKLTNEDVYQNIQSLTKFSRILFVTMRPGDEDAQLIAYLSRHEHSDVCLLMLTRGERMANYSGYETSVDLGIIHSQEMLKAANITNCEIMATSAMDVGDYSSASKVFSHWDKEKLLSNIVWAIREFRPNIIIVPDKNNIDSTNEIVQQLVIEANNMSNNKDYFPVQLAGRFSELAAHSAEEIFLQLSDSTSVNKDKCIVINTNTIDAATSLTYNQIAKQSYLCERSIFKNLDSIAIKKDTQYLKPLLSSSTLLFQNQEPLNKNISFDFNNDVSKILQQFDFLQPEKSLSALIDLYKFLDNSDMDIFWKKVKLKKLQNIILKCGGISANAFTNEAFGVKGKRFNSFVNVTNNLADIHISDIAIGDSATNLNLSLHKGNNFLFSKKIYISFDKNAYQPFWLNNPIDFEHSDYYIDDSMTDKLEDTACFSARINLTINNLPLSVKVPLIYKCYDRMQGEITEPFYIVEPMLVAQRPTVLLTNVTGDTKANKNTEVTLKFRPLFDSTMYTILNVQEVGKFAKNKNGIITNQPRYLYHRDTIINFKNNDVFKINIPVSKNDDATLLAPSVALRFPEGGQSFDADLKKLSYPYIPTIIYNYHNQTTVINNEIKTRGNKIAYLFGLQEDATDEALRQLGYQIDYLDINYILQNTDSLKNYHAIIIGNYLPLDKDIDTTEIKMAKYNLENYVYRGGNLISLSNNEANNLMPLHLEVSSKNISNTVNTQIIIEGDSSLFNYPNKINPLHLRSWKGSLAYGFSNKYDNKYIPALKIILDDYQGFIYPLFTSMLGSGKIIYCNLDIPFQTMNAQSDAFKLLANLISYKYQKSH